MKNTRSIIGVDLGGTKIAAARFDASDWSVQDSRRMPTGKHTFTEVLAEVNAMIAELKTDDVMAIGLGVPGLVDVKTGKILAMPNIPGAQGIDPREHLTHDLPLAVLNDAQAFTLAEAMTGAGKGHDVVIGITMGTGVGGGIVIDGTLQRGSHGAAGEIGHMLIKPGMPPIAGSEGRGEAEEFFSGTALRKRCTQAEKPEDLLNGAVCEFLHADIDREVAWMCANVTHLLDPSVIVFGGSAGLALAPHLEAIERELKAWTLPGTPLPKLATAVTRESGMLGAAIFASQKQ